MPSLKTEAAREMVAKRYRNWRFWKSFHTWTYVGLGAISSAVATFVAVNSRYNIVCKEHTWIWALIAAVLTFVISALGAQAEAKSFELGARMLEGALARYDTDPEFGDLELGKVLSNAIDALNKKS